MTEAQKTVLNLTSAALFGKPVTIPSETDWQAVYDEIRSQEVVALLYPLSSDLDIPKGVLKQWSEDRDKYLLNNAKNISGHFTVQKLMDEAGIPCVILKGLASASYYPDYLLRAFGDVDFLVARENFKKATSLLQESDYKFVDAMDSHHLYIRNGIYYEPHKEISEFPDSSVRDVFSNYFSDFFESAVPFTHEGKVCMIPSDRHHATILLVHSAVHLWSSGLGLRHLCDWAVFVDKMSDSFFEKELQPVFKNLGLWTFAGILTNLCSNYLGLRKCEWAITASKGDLDRLIDDLFIFGDFGVVYEKNDNRNPSLGSDSLFAFFTLLNNRAKSVFPKVSDNPLLLPAGWAYITVRYLLRMVTGRRSISMAKRLLSNRTLRRDISKDWHLFEKRG